jgi:hypothetical protein
MTEQEAKTKWCPMARVAVPVGLTVNRISVELLAISDDKERAYFEQQQKNCQCIASKCACWQWNIPIIDMVERKNWRGHCGLTR